MDALARGSAARASLRILAGVELRVFRIGCRGARLAFRPYPAPELRDGHHHSPKHSGSGNTNGAHRLPAARARGAGEHKQACYRSPLSEDPSGRTEHIPHRRYRHEFDRLIGVPAILIDERLEARISTRSCV